MLQPPGNDEKTRQFKYKKIQIIKAIPLNIKKPIFGQKNYIKYKLQRPSFKAFKNFVEKHKYYTNKMSIIYRHYKT